MIIALLSIVFLAPIFALLIYNHQGKKQLVKLDLVQFIYLFVMSPVLFVWIKSFTFFFLRGELNESVSINELFIIDTVLSVLSFYIFSAISIHTLTKTFRLHKDHNPLFDIFELSEYFHLWWSHLIIWIGVMVLLVFVSVVNLFYPIQFSQYSFTPLWSIVAGMFLGVTLYFGIVVRTYLDSPEMQSNYLRIMKLCFALFFAIHVVLYVLVNPVFSSSYAVYWTVLNIYLTTVCCALFLRSSRIRAFIRYNLSLLRFAKLLNVKK